MDKLVNKPLDPDSSLKRQETFRLPAYEAMPLETNYLIPKLDACGSSESAASSTVRTPATSKKVSARPNLEALQEAVDNVKNPRERESEGSTADVKINKNYREPLRSSNTHWSSVDDLESCITPLHDSRNNLAATKVSDEKAKEADTAPKDAGPQFGWIKGVLVRCLLNIWSVLLFIRLSWVVGEAGVMYASAIILLSAVVCGLTALSMSAICTNGVVRGGGAYYMISRSLGPEFGGAIGLVFGLANAVAAAMHIVGFAETASNVLIQYDMPIVRGHPLHDIRIIGCVTLVILFGIVMIGMEWEARAQLVSLVVLLCAMANFVVGTFLSPNDDKLSRGFTGYSGQTFARNFGPAFRDHSFVEVFAVFFPAATGILAGANISGDLRDAQSAIPKGTLLAILIATSVYLVFVWILGATIVREAVGPFAAAVAGAMTMASTGNITGTTQKASLTLNDTSLHVANAPNYQCDGESKCAFGLLNDFRAVEMASAFGPLILAGIVAAASSSALAALISAPKVMQALAIDKLFPYIHVLAKGYGKNNEPWRAYVVTFIIAAACIGIAELNMIAMIISQFFLTVYALINYACFDASRSSSPGFRPRFRYYSKWTALLGAVLCLAAMFAMSWRAALVATVVIGLLWFYIHQVSKPQVSWGTSYEANIYRRTLEGAIKLTTEVEEHVKTYRPQVLVLCGNPAHRPALVDIAGAFAGDARALMICANVVCAPSVLITGKKQQEVEPRSLREQRQQLQDEAYDWLKRRNVQAFYAQISSTDSVRAGARALMECAGVGRLRPNVVFLGYLTSWLNAFDSGGTKNKLAPTLSVEEYVGIIRDAFELNMGVGVLHMSSNGMDICEKNAGTLVDERDGEHSALGIHPQEHTNHLALNSTPHKSLSAYDLTHSDEHQLSRLNPIESILLNKSKMTNRFQDDVLEATSKEIHVWWLYDDGGLTVLIPYLLSQKWKQFKLKIFYLASSTSSSDAPDDNDSRRASNTSKNSKVSNVQTTETTKISRSGSEKTVETAERQSTPDKQQEPMMRLLGKLRIEVDAATPVSLTKPTVEERIGMLRAVKTYLGRYYAGNKFSEEDSPKPNVQAEAATTVTSEQEFEAHSEQTLRKLLLCKHIRERSQKAALIVVSLPMHGRQTSPALYMTWLDCLTGALSPSSSGSTRRSEQDLEQAKETTRLTASSVACGESMPPILLLRGNQQNVLTLDL